MQDIIRRILEMDQKAQAITDEARLEKLDSEREVAAEAQRFRDEQLARARKRIQINREMEQTIAQQTWQRREERYRRQEARLDALYAENRERWVSELVGRVLDPEV